MRILHLEASSGWGGQEIRILREAGGMRAKGHEVILGVMRGGRLIEEARSQGFIVYSLPFQRRAWLICLLQLLRLMRRHAIDLVNTHSSLDSWIGGVAARIAGRKIVRTRHLSAPPQKGLNSRLLYGALADFVVTTSSEVLPLISAQSGKSLTQCRMVATGVDPDEVQAEEAERRRFREEIGLSPADFLVGTACFMRSWKGIETFLQAAVLLRNCEGLRWMIIGGGHAEKYRRLAQELKLDGVVHFTGHLVRPFAALGALDLFALLSTANEGISQAMLQAAFLERPLLSTGVGGLKEVCLHGQTGLLVPPFSPQAVADAVCALKADPAQRREMGQRAKALAVERFLWRHTLDAMEGVYRQVGKEFGENGGV